MAPLEWTTPTSGKSDKYKIDLMEIKMLCTKAAHNFPEGVHRIELQLWIYQVTKHKYDCCRKIVEYLYKSRFVAGEEWLQFPEFVRRDAG